VRSATFACDALASDVNVQEVAAADLHIVPGNGCVVYVSVLSNVCM